MAARKTALSLLLGFIVIELGNAWETDPMRHTRIFVGEQGFQMLLADTHPLRLRGLSGRSELSEAHGMLFDFQGARNSIWMKGMQFPLTVAWVSDAGEVVAIKHMEPCAQTCVSWSPNEPARYVLEFPHWIEEAQQIQVGEEVRF